MLPLLDTSYVLQFFCKTVIQRLHKHFVYVEYGILSNVTFPTYATISYTIHLVL